MSKLWLVGQVISGTYDVRDGKWGDDYCWEANGIFESEELAVAACRTEDYFVMPLELNQSLPHEKVDAPFGSYYPLKDTGDDKS